LVGQLNCDRIAHAYRWIEYLVFGGELERRRFRYLSDVAGARNVLVLGDGDGRFLERFARENPDAAIDYVDSSSHMLELARNRAGACNIRYKLANARTLPLPSGFYDLIVTHFFLDCFDKRDIALLVARLASTAAPGAKWLVSEFRQPQRGWRAVWARLWLNAMYAFFGLATGLKTRGLTDHRPLLAKHGFRIECEETTWFGLLASELMGSSHRTSAR
jgi:ubiquinone/menaquinone biosynthesis C-methylase UbiE